MHQLGPYVVKGVTDGGMVMLVKLNGEPFLVKVNGSCLKPYTCGLAIRLTTQSTVFATRGAKQGHRTINIHNRHWYRGKDTMQRQRVQKQECNRFSRQQCSALQTFRLFRTSQRDFAPRSPHRQSDLRASHGVCVWGLVGMESPHSMFWGSNPSFGQIMLEDSTDYGCGAQNVC